MATRIPPAPQLDTLAAILEQEVLTSEALLAASEAIEASLDPLDFDALEASIATRGHDLHHLEALEIRAGKLRGPEFIPPNDLAGNLELLQDLTHRIQMADARARKVAGRTAEGLRRETQNVNKARQVIRGYHGPADQRPRFADKKG